MLSGLYSKELKSDSSRSSNQELEGYYPTEAMCTNFGDANNFSIFERNSLWTTINLNKEKAYNFKIRFLNFWQMTKRTCRCCQFPPKETALFAMARKNLIVSRKNLIFLWNLIPAVRSMLFFFFLSLYLCLYFSLSLSLSLWLYIFKGPNFQDFWLSMCLFK